MNENEIPMEEFQTCSICKAKKTASEMTTESEEITCNSCWSIRNDLIFSINEEAEKISAKIAKLAPVEIWNYIKALTWTQKISNQFSVDYLHARVNEHAKSKIIAEIEYEGSIHENARAIAILLLVAAIKNPSINMIRDILLDTFRFHNLFVALKSGLDPLATILPKQMFQIPRGSASNYGRKNDDLRNEQDRQYVMTLMQEPNVPEILLASWYSLASNEKIQTSDMIKKSRECRHSNALYSLFVAIAPNVVDISNVHDSAFRIGYVMSQIRLKHPIQKVEIAGKNHWLVATITDNVKVQTPARLIDNNVVISQENKVNNSMVPEISNEKWLCNVCGYELSRESFHKSMEKTDQGTARCISCTLNNDRARRAIDASNTNKSFKEWIDKTINNDGRSVLVSPPELMVQFCDMTIDSQPVKQFIDSNFVSKDAVDQNKWIDWATKRLARQCNILSDRTRRFDELKDKDLAKLEIYRAKVNILMFTIAFTTKLSNEERKQWLGRWDKNIPVVDEIIMYSISDKVEKNIPVLIESVSARPVVDIIEDMTPVDNITVQKTLPSSNDIPQKGQNILYRTADKKPTVAKVTEIGAKLKWIRLGEEWYPIEDIEILDFVE